MRKHRLVTLVALVAVLAGCASTVPGTAVLPPKARPVEQAPRNDPCQLLTPAEAKGLGLAEQGTFSPGNEAQLIPPMCQWRPADPEADFDPVDVGISEDIAIEEYFASKPPVEQLELGGTSWGRYESVFGPTICNLAVKRGRLAFVVIAGGNTSDPTKACDVPKAVAPLVAARL
ncbi:Protein of unknown function [Amycolatopsis arida]|uniref:DUF3558 domain-containing protein n=1 Tax=Amycolatopsis arida TaxID=587909 RepID=A0A1I5YLK9_9PSEU|nr:DUF3558 family protein [Amycolatopsis arida]TDX90608.1 uncharacterized protein DUF3558 [Amycolatopsis arida]SFQ45131.1 Protein of unknown function [Amycolatopsis arida]